MQFVGRDVAKVAVRLSQATPFTGNTVLISRDDEFADALASGLLQNAGPLLLVPRDGPLPQMVRDQISDKQGRSSLLHQHPGTATCKDAPQIFAQFPQRMPKAIAPEFVRDEIAS